MMSLLDGILDSMETRIVSEQHDTRKIDIGGGASASLESRIKQIERGKWDAGEYGITAAGRFPGCERRKGTRSRWPRKMNK